ncbi:homocitrate synthase [Hirsutella rhossiliensis]|uniref:Homocitrate synthase n=1 Tax=Hirsutella rhossiliensis TaxID=111463 RepID=A0A9P8MRX3_9HYPO|nr:homocitrate synthase [Hirsutella rhossiliensis]KAH0960803.1 homocitrate synthase [Hirsutella rhossiliensis]
MPLHLLGKKSWNVYNADNIARVRRDEAAAKAAEEAEEQRMQEIDAQRRLAILRGEAPPPVDEAKDGGESRDVGILTDTSRNEYDGGARRKRKRPGEDDTDFELRLAKDRNEAPKKTPGDVRQQTSSAPIVDRTGHIDLFGDERSRAHAQKNEEAEDEARKKKREYEDQYTMRFSNAAGKEGLARPWYSQQDMMALGEAPSKDVWGNEDPRRKAREAQRLAVNDPLAMMKRGAAKVREIVVAKGKGGIMRGTAGTGIAHLLDGPRCGGQETASIELEKTTARGDAERKNGPVDTILLAGPETP